MSQSTSASTFVLLVSLMGCGGSTPIVTGPAAEPPAKVAGTSDGGSTAAATPPAPATSRPPVATSFTLDGNALTLPSEIIFSAGAATLDETASSAALWYLVDYLEAKSYISTLRIEGHSSDAGTDAQILTEQRALAVATWLVAHGVACDRLIAVGFGNNKPIADNSTPEGKNQNRRISVINAALRGRAIGGMPLDGGGQSAGAVCK
jgi:OmpA-OmpF porin, OOP family